MRWTNIPFSNTPKCFILLVDSKNGFTNKIPIVHCKTIGLSSSLFTCSWSSSLQDVEDKIPWNGLNSASWNQKWGSSLRLLRSSVMMSWRDVIASLDMCLSLWDAACGDKNWNEANAERVLMLQCFNIRLKAFVLCLCLFLIGHQELTWSCQQNNPCLVLSLALNKHVAKRRNEIK